MLDFAAIVRSSSSDFKLVDLLIYLVVDNLIDVAGIDFKTVYVQLMLLAIQCKARFYQLAYAGVVINFTRVFNALKFLKNSGLRTSGFQEQISVNLRNCRWAKPYFQFNIG